MKEINKKPDRRILRSKSALREALLGLMSQKPFTSISITEIVEQANYNRGTFYSNYESKEALLDDVISELIGRLLQSYRAPYESAEVFRISEMAANSVMIFQHVFENAKIYAILMKSDVLPVLREKMFIALKQISQEELVHPEHDIDQELLAIYSIHALLGLVFYWVESGFKHPTSYMQEQLIKLIRWRPSDARTVVVKRAEDLR
ncbi:TetR/AcrR family transcriptional regulator [Paenibacillus doosanensis]|uniref:HTH-type transcriptional regulator MtrR n=1 Tax=Paenibacillus konkukensis TaxID=2020716 RepID=A0ABY4RKZ1_9BACL|nr:MULTISPECIES: TetR/AcrR family transcriptional regulator [Paenibacillus]MCS7463647.1 TetR/AcrR family transcriptional regulator [Paenibacillus doosanensis]UQZ83172.1 HTH-type transcriptional regulator MtrR [Paenibacillus konkukensis]